MLPLILQSLNIAGIPGILSFHLAETLPSSLSPSTIKRILIKDIARRLNVNAFNKRFFLNLVTGLKPHAFNYGSCREKRFRGVLRFFFQLAPRPRTNCQKGNPPIGFSAFSEILLSDILKALDSFLIFTRSIFSLQRPTSLKVR